MKKTMIRTSVLLVLGCTIFTILYQKIHMDFFETLAISFGTAAYHFVMRLIVGYGIQSVYHNRMNYKRKWFQQKAFEPKLYRKLKVKKWKEKMPTFEQSTFSLKEHTMEEIIQGMCQAEVVHEVIIVLSFVPILFTCIWGTFWVFLVTSVLAAVFDLLFVILQRFNRPRLMKMVR